MNTADLIALLTAIVEFLLLVVAGFALCFARGQVSAARDANRQTAALAEAASEQTIRDSQRTTRPYVYGQLVPSMGALGSWDLRITNTGRSVARGLTLSTDWPTAPDEFATNLRRAFETSQDLPPGGSLRYYWHLRPTSGTFTDGSTSAGMPPSGWFELRYSGDDPNLPEFTERSTFDVDVQAVVMPSPAEGKESNRPKGMARDLRNIEHALRAVATALGELRR